MYVYEDKRSVCQWITRRYTALTASVKRVGTQRRRIPVVITRLSGRAADLILSKVM